ncbi:TetR/AcrR family transcriptional regulator [Convivina intestini]|uniref:TetR/AcrR family transcriptional regulator n=1 Tax=Convivina intestini TaxID=1505726 RepID=UPI00200E9E80|nr:TetR/AcrR family transcriptional regulator [Convivina intestini]CAH1852555.1 hypothetical protein R078131_00504 [Convivina intestini]
MGRLEQKQKTRTKLISSAVALFKEKGIEQTNIADITKASDVSVGTFYVHFKGKEAIVSAIYYEAFNEYMDKKINGIDTTNQKLSILLLEIGLIELDYVQSVGIEITTAAFIANLNLNQQFPGYHLKKRTFSKKIADIIKRNTDQIDQDSDDMLTQFETILRGIMLTWCFTNDTIAIRSIGEPILRKYLFNTLD